MATYDDIAAVIVARIPRRNDIVGGVIGSSLYETDGTPIVTVSAQGATRKAVYTPPHAIREGGAVFVMRTGPSLTSDLLIVTTNYQIGAVGAGWGAAPWGGSPFGG